MANAMTPGKYRAKAVSHKFGKSSKGTEQIYIDFELTSGEHKGQHLGYYGFFSEATADRTLESLEYCGWDGNSLGAMRGLGSKEVELVVELEKNEQDNKEYLKVRWINKIGGGVKEELTGAGMSALENRLKGMILARKQKRPPTREPGDDSDEFGPTEYDGDEPPV
jgi:hypothetical protein